MSRGPKWVAVNPGHAIPAGQPHAIQYKHHANWCTWAEYTRPHVVHAGWQNNSEREWVYPDRVVTYYVDSTWRPPINLPTEPTWGILLRRGQRPEVVNGNLTSEGKFITNAGYRYRSEITGWFPLTNEQAMWVEIYRR